MQRPIVAALLLGGALQAHAQSPSPSPAKKELVQKFLQLQQPGLESMARSLVQEPVALMMQPASRALQSQVPADKREAVAKTIEAEVKKYVDEALPLVRERANAAAPSTMGKALEEKFSEDELKQLINWFESPVNKKYLQVSADMQKDLVQKVVADSRPLIEPKIQALEQKVRAALGVPAASAAPAVPSKPAAATSKAASGAARATAPPANKASSP